MSHIRFANEAMLTTLVTDKPTKALRPTCPVRLSYFRLRVRSARDSAYSREMYPPSSLTAAVLAGDGTRFMNFPVAENAVDTSTRQIGWE